MQYNAFFFVILESVGITLMDILMGEMCIRYFLAVQDSSISDIVCRSVPWSQLTIRA